MRDHVLATLTRSVPAAVAETALAYAGRRADGHGRLRRTSGAARVGRRGRRSHSARGVRACQRPARVPAARIFGRRVRRSRVRVQTVGSAAASRQGSAVGGRDRARRVACGRAPSDVHAGGHGVALPQPRFCHLGHHCGGQEQRGRGRGVAVLPRARGRQAVRRARLRPSRVGRTKNQGADRGVATPLSSSASPPPASRPRRTPLSARAARCESSRTLAATRRCSGSRRRPGGATSFAST